jgi:hypothetical protein
MPHEPLDPDVLDGSTILAVWCLALLAVSYVALGSGILRMAMVELPAAFQAHMAGF